jgi:hypothetical protein
MERLAAVKESLYFCVFILCRQNKTAHASICAGGRIVLLSPYRHALKSRSSYQSLAGFQSCGACPLSIDERGGL